MIIKNPNIPDKNVKCVVVDCNAPEELFGFLDLMDINYIKTTTVKNTIDAVSTHPDMQICNLGNGMLVCEPTTYEYYKNKLKLFDVNLTRGDSVVGCNYPFDIAYNVVITGGFLLHNLKYTDKTILQIAHKYGLGIYDTKQGYTKCATCIIDNNTVITDDVGIYNNCNFYGIDALLAEKDKIMLGSRNDGFLGGCCGMIGHKKLLFCGDIKRHKSYEHILKFADEHSVELISAFDGPLTDIGSIIPVIQE